jgi:hypothetical protein
LDVQSRYEWRKGFVLISNPLFARVFGMILLIRW